MNEEDSIENILSQLISFYPVTSNQDSVLKLLNFIQTKLDSVSVTSTIITTNDVHMLYANTQDQIQSRVMLQSHIDVVPANEDLQKAVVKDGIMYGRGARDMLFAAAAYVHFFIKNKDRLHNLNIAMLLSGDEEVGGVNTVPVALQKGYSAEVVWLSDAGNKLSDLVVSAKGVFNFDLVVRGVAHHGSRPWEGDSATSKLVKLLHELEAYFEKPTNEVTTCTITQLEAGDSVNKGPAEARAHIDIRYTSRTELERCKSIVEQLCNKYNASLESVLREPSYTVDVNSDLVKEYIRINESITNTRVNKISVSGSSDARYFSEHGIPVIMTRPISEGSHSDNEWINLNSLKQYYKIMEQYILKVATIGE